MGTNISLGFLCDQELQTTWQEQMGVYALYCGFFSIFSPSNSSYPTKFEVLNTCIAYILLLLITRNISNKLFATKHSKQSTRHYCVTSFVHKTLRLEKIKC